MDTRGKPSRTVALLDLLLLLAVVAFFYPRIALPLYTSPGGDVVNLMLPARHWAWRWLSQGIIPLWNPQTFGGVPFHGAMQAAIFYPPSLILGCVLSPLAAINLLRFAHIYALGAFTWLFLRCVRQCARPAALLGAIAIAGSAHVASHTDHVNQLCVMAWLPALVTCQWRWWQTGNPRLLLLFSLVVALQVLAGHPQALFYSMLLNAMIAVAWLVRSRTQKAEGRGRKAEGKRQKAKGGRQNLKSKIQNPKSAVIVLVIAVAVGFLLASIQLVPTMETSRLSRRATDNLDYVLFGEMHRRHLLTLLAPRAFGDPPYYADPSFGSESNAYVGCVTFLLALMAVGRGIYRRRPYALFWALVALAAFALALGRYGPLGSEQNPSPLFRAYLWLLPPARHLRVPPRVLLVATFAMAVLAAEAFHWLTMHRRWRSSRVRTMATWAVLAVLVAELWTFQRRQFHNVVVRYDAPDVLLRGETGELLSPLLRLDRSQSSLPEFRLFRLMRNDPDYLIDPRSDAVRNRFLRLQPNLGLVLGFAEIEGYEEGLLPPLRYYDFLNYFNRNLRNPDPDAVLLGLMNVRYLYADHDQPVRSQTWRLLGEVIEPGTGRQYRLYENPLWLPRVLWADWLPPQIALGQLRGTSSRGGPLSPRMTDRKSYGLRVDALASRGGLVEADRLATLHVRAVEPNRIIIANLTQRDGKLLVAQNAYPGWIVEAGRVSVPLHYATDFSSAAIVPAGAAQIVIAYRPFSFRIGVYLTGVGLVILAATFMALRSISPQRRRGRLLDFRFWILD